MNDSGHGKIQDALNEAEQRTSAHIAVRIVPDKQLDALERAKIEFAQKRLHLKPEHDAVLILVAPRAKRFAVFGDEEVHRRIGQAGWQELVDRAQPVFASEGAEVGTVALINTVGAQLEQHFPRAAP